VTNHSDTAEDSLVHAQNMHVFNRVKEHVEFTACHILLAGLIYHPVTLFLDKFLAPTEVATLWVPFHFALLVGCAVGLVLYRLGKSVRKLTLTMMMFHVGVVAYGMNSYGYLYPDWILVGSKFIQAIVVFFLILCPVVRISSAFLVLFCYVGLMAYAHYQVALMQFSLVSDFLVAIGSFATFVLLRWRFSKEAKRDFVDQLCIAPRQVVVNAAIKSKSVEELFKAKARFCTCISSDWRGYQKLAKKIADEDLARALGEYYEMAEQALLQSFPQGNYFADWIADEFFVVAYAETEQEQIELAVSSLRFALALLQMKDKFVKKYGFPSSIDVGVTAGNSVIGLMGPAALRKCTALGEVPGRARRLQEAGKLLRTRLDERDRVVFDRNLLLRLRAGFDIKLYKLTGDESLRDVSERTLHYLQLNDAERGDQVSSVA